MKKSLHPRCPMRLSYRCFRCSMRERDVRASCQNMRSDIRCGLNFTAPSQFASRIAFMACFRVARSIRSMNSTPSRWSVSCWMQRASTSRSDYLHRVAAIGKAAGHCVEPPLDVVVDAGERQAALLAVLLLVVGEAELRVDQVAALAAHDVGEHPQPHPDLRRRQAPWASSSVWVRSFTRFRHPVHGKGPLFQKFPDDPFKVLVHRTDHRFHQLRQGQRERERERERERRRRRSFPHICYNIKRRLNAVACGFTDRGDRCS